MALLISILLAIVPLLGLVWIALDSTFTTVGGLFLGLILLTLSGIMLLNAFWQARDQGLLKFMHKDAPQAQKTS